MKDIIIKHIIIIYIRAQSALIGPPLGTVLGNLGINTINFCKDFNDFTSKLPKYFKLKVKIQIFENRTYKFIIYAPSTGSLLNILSFSKNLEIQINNKEKYFIKRCIYFYNIISLALFKFNYLNLISSLPIIWGSLKSTDILVII